MKSVSIKKLVLSAIISILGFSMVATLPTFADTDICSLDVSAEVKAAAGCSGTGVSVDTLPSVIVRILNAIILVAGLIAVVFVVIGGINYMTSSGDAAKIKKAKDTILYAIIGLVVCALAFAIVNFVINNILNSESGKDITAMLVNNNIIF